MTLAPETTPDSPRPRLLERRHLPLAVGSVALVTLGAFENRAVTTALPTMVRDLDALGLFGAANAAPMASFLVALALAGLWADRSGPVPSLRLGAALFALAQLVVGTAGSMHVVIAARLLGGLAEGLLDVALMVLVARVLPAQLRPRMFSLFAAAWVLPSVLGPLATGVVTEQLGWRWVFLGALGLLVPTWLMLRPAVRQARRLPAGPDDVDTSAGRLAPWAGTAAVSVFALTLAGERLTTDLASGALGVVLAGGGLVVGVRRLVPPGTFRGERGLPAVVATRGLTAAAFGGAGAFLPLLLTVVHGFTPSTAGVTLSITGVMWAVGSWLQGRDHTLPRPTVLRAGLGLITLGLLGASTLALPWLPVWLGLGAWAVAGVGMGLASSSLSVLVLDLSTDRDQGRNNAAALMAGSTSMAIAFAAYGTLVAVAAPAPGTPTFLAILLGTAATALAGFAVAVRVSSAEATDPEGGGAPDSAKAAPPDPAGEVNVRADPASVARARRSAAAPATSSC